jgi:hypothetical protein
MEFFGRIGSIFFVYLQQQWDHGRNHLTDEFDIELMQSTELNLTNENQSSLPSFLRSKEMTAKESN